MSSRRFVRLFDLQTFVDMFLLGSGFTQSSHRAAFSDFGTELIGGAQNVGHSIDGTDSFAHGKHV